MTITDDEFIPFNTWTFLAAIGTAQSSTWATSRRDAREFLWHFAEDENVKTYIIATDLRREA